MQQKIVTAHSASQLNSMLEVHIKDGWQPIGSHHVVVTHIQNRFSGMQHKDSESTLEYSQSIRKSEPVTHGS